MRLIPDAIPSLAGPMIAEDDPLPPDDRATMGAALALGDLYSTQAPRLHRFFARCSGRQDAGDLVQESFARLAAADAARGNTIEQPEAYLHRIATNVLRNRAKIALQRSIRQHVPAEEERLVGPDLISALEARDLLNRLQTSLMRLKPGTREIFLAHRVDGLSYKEIAENRGLSEKGVEWHMRKAIAHLDRMLRRR